MSLPSSLWSRGGLSWRELARRVSREMEEDHVFGRAAELAYYFLLSIFPLLLVLTAVLAHLVQESTALRRELFDYLRQVVPSQDALDLVRTTLRQASENRGGKLPVGLVMWLVLGSQAVVAVGRTLDAAYGVRKRRPFWLAQVMAIGLTVVFEALTVLALGLIFQGSNIAGILAERFSFGQAFIRIWGFLQWPLVLVFVFLAFELVYNVAPSGLKQRRLHWLTPGACAGVLVWLSASFLFKLYISRFNLYSLTYGSLGALIVLMFWFYITGLAILLGGEINSELMKVAGEVRRRPAKPGRSRTKKSAEGQGTAT